MITIIKCVILLLSFLSTQAWATVAVVKYPSGTPVQVCQASDSNASCRGTSTTPTLSQVLTAGNDGGGQDIINVANYTATTSFLANDGASLSFLQPTQLSIDNGSITIGQNTGTKAWIYVPDGSASFATGNVTIDSSGNTAIPTAHFGMGTNGAALAALYSMPFAIVNSINNGNNKYNIGFFGADTYPNSLGLVINVDPNNNYTEFQGTVIGASAADIKFNPEGGDTYIGSLIKIDYTGGISSSSGLLSLNNANVNINGGTGSGNTLDVNGNANFVQTFADQFNANGGGYFYSYNSSPAVYTNSSSFFIDGGNGRLAAGFVASPQDFFVIEDNNTFEGTNSYPGDNYLNSTPAGSTYIGYVAGSGGSSSGATLDVNGFIHTQDGSSLGWNGSYGLVVTAPASLDNGQITTTGGGELDATTLSAGNGTVYGNIANHDTINDWTNGCKSIDVLNGRLIDNDCSTIVANWRNGTGNFTVDNNLTINGISILDSSGIASLNVSARQLADSSGTVAVSWSNTGLSSDTSNTQSWIVKTSNVYGPSFDLWSTDTGGRRYRLISTGSSDAGGAGILELYDGTAGAARVTMDLAGQVKILNTFFPGAALKDSTGSVGTSGQFLTSTVTGSAWSSVLPTVSRISLTNQAADITTTTLTGTAGLYRVSYSLQDTTSDITAGAVVLTIGYTDGAGSATSTATQVLTGLGRQSGTVFLQLASGNLTYATSHTGLFGTAKYALYITTEKL